VNGEGKAARGVDWDEVLLRIARRLKEEMESQGLTAYRIEKWIGLRAASVQRILAGADVSVSHWLMLVWSLGCCRCLEEVLPPRPKPMEIHTKRTFTPSEELILDLLRIHRGELEISVRDLAEGIGKSVSQTYRSLNNLERQGIITKQRFSGNVYRFVLTSNAE